VNEIARGRQQRPYPGDDVGGSADEQCQRPGVCLGKTAQHGSVQQRHPMRERRSKAGHRARTDRGHVDHRRSLPDPRCHADGSVRDFTRGCRVSQHQKDHVSVAYRVGRCRAGVGTSHGQRVSATGRAVPYRHVVPRVHEPPSHASAHRAQTDPGDLGHQTLPGYVRRQSQAGKLNMPGSYEPHREESRSNRSPVDRQPYQRPATLLSR
jgi:hypothetical protein